MDNEFVDIPGFNGRYQINKISEIKTFFTNKKSQIGRLLMPNINRDGYLKTNLVCMNGERKSFKVHILVAKTFIPNPLNKPCVNHIDSNKLNNHFNNLEWCTYKENSQHYINSPYRRTNKKGEDAPGSKLSKIQVIQIFNSDKTYREIAIEFNVSQSNIACIKQGKSWYSITGSAYNRKRITEEVAAQIISSIKLGKSSKQISEEYGITHQNSEQIRRKNIWKKLW